MMHEDVDAVPAAPARKKRHTPLVLSAVLAVALIGGAVYWRSVMAASNDDGKKRTFTVRQLAEFDGEEGKECYVAVDGTVYKIEQGRLWKDGQHLSSKGQAGCGRDLSSVIGKSPHGKSKLSTLEVIGTLE